MPPSPYPILAREGRVHLVIAVLCGIVATWLFGWASIIVWLLVLLVVQFFSGSAASH